MMNHPPSKPKGSASAAPRARARTSRLAVTALALAVVPCCPFISIGGAALGILAARRIERSGGALGGKRLARAAIIAGLALTLLSGLLLVNASSSMRASNERQMARSIEAFVQEAASGRIAEARGRWIGSKRQAPFNDAIAEFGSTAMSRYGRLQRFTIASVADSGSLTQRQFDVAGVFVFDGASLTGSASFTLAPAAGGNTIWPRPLLRGIRIDDPKSGQLRLPQSSASVPNKASALGVSAPSQVA